MRAFFCCRCVGRCRAVLLVLRKRIRAAPVPDGVRAGRRRAGVKKLRPRAVRYEYGHEGQYIGLEGALEAISCREVDGFQQVMWVFYKAPFLHNASILFTGQFYC